MPFAGNAFQGSVTTIFEAQTRASHQILDGIRYEHLTGTCQRSNACANVNGYTADVIAHHFAFPGMQSSTDIDPERTYSVVDGASATNAARWTIKGGKNTVTGRLNFAAAKALETAPDRNVMVVEELAPTAVAERGSFLGRANNIGKENRTSVESRFDARFKYRALLGSPEYGASVPCSIPQSSQGDSRRVSRGPRSDATSSSRNGAPKQSKCRCRSGTPQNQVAYELRRKRKAAARSPCPLPAASVALDAR